MQIAAAVNQKIICQIALSVLKFSCRCREEASKTTRAVIGLIIGVAIGCAAPTGLLTIHPKIIAVVTLAAINSLTEGIRAHINRRFEDAMLISSLIVNVAIGLMFVGLGEVLSLELYLVAALIFGLQIMKNIVVIRRALFNRR